MQIGWSGLLRKARDEGNGMEIGQATDAAQLYTSFASKGAAHLGEAAAATKKWIGNASEVTNSLFLSTLFLKPRSLILFCR